MQYKKNYQGNTLYTMFMNGSVKRYETLSNIFTMIKNLDNNTITRLKPLKEEGRPPYHPEILFKAILIQHLYSFSDRELQENMLDQISIRKFIGIVNDTDIPSSKTIREFRKQLQKNGTIEEYFNTLISRISEYGIEISKGSIIDSSIVEAKGSKTPYKERRDKDARKTQKHGKRHFGYKYHVVTDDRNKIIKKVDVTSANVHDYEKIDMLLHDDVDKYYGDKGYYSKVDKVIVGDKYKIMQKGYRNQPISNEDIERNNVISKIRSRVEHVFGRMKNEFKINKVPFFDIESNRFYLILLCFVYNIKVIIKKGKFWDIP